MQDLTLKRAVAQIQMECEDAHEAGESAPFVFIVGAGISHPPVPLARDMIVHFRKRADERGSRIPERLRSGVEEYSACMAAAYPQAGRRQGYIQGLIEGKPISQANFRLAHLLLNEREDKPRIANLVITPNFDDFLSRALRTFGKLHRICDHPSTVLRVEPDSSETQILQVHGSYRFYELANVRSELDGRASISQDTIQTMGDLLNRILTDRGVLVVGYSGWENDVIMSALRRRLAAGGLKRNLYWFCYRREEATRLPYWLRDHAHVHFVLPPRREKGHRDGPRSAEASLALGVSSSAMEEERLQAHHVFERLISTLSLPVPALLDNPSAFMADQLEGLLPTEDVAADNYSLRRVIQNLRQASRLEETATDEAAAGQKAWKSLRDARRQALHSQVLGAAEAVVQELEGLSEEEMEELLEALLAVVEAQESELELGRRAVTLGLNVVDRDRASTSLQIIMARLLRRQGFQEYEKGNWRKAEQYQDEILRRFGTSEDSGVMEWIAKGMVGRSAALGQQQRWEEALEACAEVVERFGDRAEATFQEQVAKALVNQGWALSQQEQWEEALTTFSELVERLDESSEPILQAHLAKALVGRSIALGELQRWEQALEAADDVVKRFGPNPQQEIQKQVANALANYSSISVKQGKILHQKEFAKKAKAHWKRALVKARQASEHQVDAPIARLNLAYTQFLLGKETEARENLQQALKLGGEELCRGSLYEATQHRIDRDEAWEALVEEVWSEMKPTP